MRSASGAPACKPKGIATGMCSRMQRAELQSKTISLPLEGLMRYSLRNYGPYESLDVVEYSERGNKTLVSPSLAQDLPGLDGRYERAEHQDQSSRVCWAGFLTLAVGLAPALAAIWLIPWFVTQDGPAHVYNAQIIAESFDPNAPSRAIYTISWKPIPNWVGHIILTGLVSWLPAWVADRIMTSATLVGLAAAVFWLRTRVAGRQGIGLAALFSALLAMNVTWLLGFTSFLLGSCLFPIGLGIWWKGRYRLSIVRIAVLSVLLCFGFFCHLVSLGLLAVGLVVLSLVGPVPPSSARSLKFRVSRLARTSLSFIPLLVPVYFYLQAARHSGPIWPVWDGIYHPWERLAWVDPITLAIKDGLPFTSLRSRAFIVFAPALWLAVGVVLWWYGRITAESRAAARNTAFNPAAQEANAVAEGCDDRQGWLTLAALFVIGGIVGPNSFGATHGEFLPQRVLLLGFIALLPVFDADGSRWPGRAVVAAILVAVGLQSAIVCDYAFYSNRTAGQIIGAGELVGRGQRIVTLLVKSRGRFRANPLLHAEDWLGVNTGNVVWNNYETRHYYFPVQFKPALNRPLPGDLESVSIHDDPAQDNPEQRKSRLAEWEKILSQHADSIDVILFWKSDEELEAITKRWFDLQERRGDVQVFRKRPAPG